MNPKDENEIQTNNIIFPPNEHEQEQNTPYFEEFYNNFVELNFFDCTNILSFSERELLMIYNKIETTNDPNDINIDIEYFYHIISPILFQKQIVSQHFFDYIIHIFLSFSQKYTEYIYTELFNYCETFSPDNLSFIVISQVILPNSQLDQNIQQIVKLVDRFEGEEYCQIILSFYEYSQFEHIKPYINLQKLTNNVTDQVFPLISLLFTPEEIYERGIIDQFIDICSKNSDLICPTMRFSCVVFESIEESFDRYIKQFHQLFQNVPIYSKQYYIRCLSIFIKNISNESFEYLIENNILTMLSEIMETSIDPDFVEHCLALLQEIIHKYPSLNDEIREIFREIIEEIQHNSETDQIDEIISHIFEIISINDV